MPITTKHICGVSVIKGKVLEATALLMQGAAGHGNVIKSLAIPESKYPFQLNNMSLWFDLAVAELNDDAIFKAAHPRRQNNYAGIRMEVNGGKGAKKGRGALDNTFSYFFGEYQLDLFIKTKAHSQIYQEEVKAGTRQLSAQRQLAVYREMAIEARKKACLPWIDKETNDLIMPTQLWPHLPPALHVYTAHEHSDFYSENPEWVDKVPVL